MQKTICKRGAAASGVVGTGVLHLLRAEESLEASDGAGDIAYETETRGERSNPEWEVSFLKSVTQET